MRSAIFFSLLLSFIFLWRPEAHACAGPVNMTIAFVEPSCFGNTDGSITITIGGIGTAPYDYTMVTPSFGIITINDSPSNSLTFTNREAGSYTIIVTSTVGAATPSCIQVFNLNQPALLTQSGSISNNVCFTGTIGAVDVSTAGGTLPYSYSWSSGEVFEDISGKANGLYSLTITDANGCLSVGNYTVTSPPDLSLSATATAPTCVGGNDGQLNLTVSGGTPGYSFNWNNGATTEDLSGLIAGPYSVTVTDANGCTELLNTNVTNPPALAATSSTTNVSCAGGNNGALNITVTNGLAPFTFLWSTGATTEDISGLVAGPYSVTIFDANGCSGISNFTITEPLPILAPGVLSPASCNGGSNGSINITPSGGTSPYTYNWSNGATTQDISGLSAGGYNVTVSDANGCSEIFNYTITEPTSISAVATSTNVSCFGGTNGSLNLTASGGTAPYTYLWSNGAITEDITNLVFGTYSVVITDNNGCLGNGNFTLTQPTALTPTGAATAVACFGGNTGSINLNVVGGTSPYTFLWSNGATTEDIAGLIAGSYSVTVTDANGCAAPANFTVTQPPSGLSAIGTTVNVTCFGGTNGSINLTASGGTAPYTYSWSNGASSEDLSGLSAGPYNVTVTDANACTFLQSFTINQPADIVTAALITNVSCAGGNNGSISLTPSGGTAPYAFLWSTGATSQNINSLSAGAYTVTITDNLGCQKIENYNVIVPPSLVLSFISTPANCNGTNTGAINLSVSGGTSPYTYLWSNGAVTEDLVSLVAGPYSITVTDANGCSGNGNTSISQPTALLLTSSNSNVSCNGGSNGSINLSVSGGTAPYAYLWNTGATTEDISGLIAGAYSVTVTDANGCTSNRNSNLTQPLTAISTSAVATPVSCNGGNNGAINATVVGGTAPYSYSWGGFGTTEDISGLSQGTYTLTVTDANGCSDVEVVNITQPLPILSNAVIVAATCAGLPNGSINLTVSGGTAPFTFLWSNGATSEDIAGLTAGSYNVQITDGNGCLSNNTFIVTQPLAISVNGLISNLLCFGSNTGSIDATISGGLAPYTYNWTTGATTEDVNGLGAGVYTLNVTGADGCTGNNSFTIVSPTDIVLNATLTNNACGGALTGAIDLSVSGGTGPYIYSWSNGASTQDLSGLATGSYMVTAEDNNGCTKFDTYSITEPLSISASAIGTDPICNGAASGNVNLTVSNGTAPYTYSWSNGGTTEDINALIAGLYTVLITDANGCTASAFATLTDPAAINAVGISSNPICPGTTGGSINISVSNGTAPYAFNWSNGSTTEDLTNVSAGAYSVLIIDANACNASFNFTITDPAAQIVNGTVTDVSSCSGAADGAISITSVTNSVAPLSYLWNTSATTSSIINLSAGSYSVDVTDGNGCIASQTFSVGEPVALIISSNVGNLSCNGDTDGSIDITIGGGNPPYTILWSNGAATEDVSNLIGGNYSVLVTDNNGCADAGNFTVAEPSLIVISGTSLDVACNGGATGAIDALISGGTAPYAFLWNTGATTEDLLNQTAGTYSIQVTDANNCIQSNNFTLTESTAITVIESITNSTCFGTANGAIDLTSVSGGNGPYAFSWSNGALTQNINSLLAGNYSVTITDNFGCITSPSYNVSEPTQVTGTASAAPNPVCRLVESFTVNASIDAAFVIDPAGGFSFDTGISFGLSNTLNVPFISNDTTINVVLRDNNGCLSASIPVSVTISTINASVTELQPVTCNGDADGSLQVIVTGLGTYTYSLNGSPAQVSDTFSGLSGGAYVITIDDGTCTYLVNGNIAEPALLTASASTTPVNLCSTANDGTVTINVSGGNGSETYTLVETATAQASNIFTGLAGGTYNFTIVDANGCNAATNATVGSPSGVDTASVVASTSNVVCNGSNEGSVTLSNITGGQSPYTYLLNSVSNATGSFSLLIAGNYTIQITDAGGCQYEKNFSISEPAPINFIMTATEATCQNADGSLIFSAPTGGNAPYEYSIDGGLNYTNNMNFTSLTSGIYNVFVRDASACAVGYPTSVPQKPGPEVYFRSSPPTCHNGSDGLIVVDSILGAVAPLQYFVNGINRGSSTVFPNLFSGEYIVTVQDATCTYLLNYYYLFNGVDYDTIIGDASITVGNTPPLTAQTLSYDTDRYLNTGSAIVYDFQGGTAPYQYSLDTTQGYIPNPSDTIEIYDLDRGSYQVYLLDNNGCTGEVIVKINVEFFIPNLITPNNDGANDYFEIMALPRRSTFKVFNSWGDRVYLNEDYNNSWDGSGLADGTYFYELILPNKKTYKGWMQILR